MKAIIAILAGYIASTTGFTAQENPAAPAARTPETAPRLLSGPYSRLYMTDGDSVFSGSGTNRLNDGTPWTGDDSIARPLTQEMIFSFYDTGPDSGRNTVSPMSGGVVAPLLFSGLTDDDVTYLRYGGTVEKKPVLHEGNKVRNAVQVISIDPLHRIRRRPVDRTELSRQALIPRQKESADLEWLSPRCVLNTWVERWMTETNEMPVVIVQVAF